MFEDALLESAGRLKTQSKFWTLGALLLNGGVLAIMILLPLLHPEALPKTSIAAMLVAPAPPPPAMQVVTKAAAVQQSRPALLRAPSIIPTHIHDSDEPPSTQPIGVMAAPSGPGTPGQNITSIFGPSPAIVVARPKPSGPLYVASRLEAGNLIAQTLPVYPPIAQAAHVTGAVILRAIISKAGTIENLSVQSGPVLLRQAALDGVRSWRYKPFLLNGEPAEVDTIITVNFTARG
jgi:periplasmic protein TonB